LGFGFWVLVNNLRHTRKKFQVEKKWFGGKVVWEEEMSFESACMQSEYSDEISEVLR